MTKDKTSVAVMASGCSPPVVPGFLPECREEEDMGTEASRVTCKYILVNTTETKDDDSFSVVAVDVVVCFFLN